MSAAAIVQFSSIELSKLLSAGRQIFDRNLAETADAVGHDPPLHHMLCVAALKNPEARTAEEVKPYTGMFHAGVLLVADVRDIAEILSVAGMPSILIDTPLNRDMQAVYLTGTLLQWRDAIVAGCQGDVGRETRQVYNQIYSQFKDMGLAAAFDLTSKPHRDHTFLLEYSA